MITFRITIHVEWASPKFRIGYQTRSCFAKGCVFFLRIFQLNIFGQLCELNCLLGSLTNIIKHKASRFVYYDRICSSSYFGPSNIWILWNLITRRWILTFIRATWSVFIIKLIPFCSLIKSYFINHFLCLDHSLIELCSFLRRDLLLFFHHLLISISILWLIRPFCSILNHTERKTLWLESALSTKFVVSDLPLLVFQFLKFLSFFYCFPSFLRIIKLRLGYWTSSKVWFTLILIILYFLLFLRQ